MNGIVAIGLARDSLFYCRHALISKSFIWISVPTYAFKFQLHVIVYILYSKKSASDTSTAARVFTELNILYISNYTVGCTINIFNVRVLYLYWKTKTKTKTLLLWVEDSYDYRIFCHDTRIAFAFFSYFTNNPNLWYKMPHKLYSNLI